MIKFLTHFPELTTTRIRSATEILVSEHFQNQVSKLHIAFIILFETLIFFHILFELDI